MRLKVTQLSYDVTLGILMSHFHRGKLLITQKKVQIWEVISCMSVGKDRWSALNRGGGLSNGRMSGDVCHSELIGSMKEILSCFLSFLFM